MEPVVDLKRTFADAEFESIEGNEEVVSPVMVISHSTLARDTIPTTVLTSVTTESRETSPLSSARSSLTRENSASPAVKPSEATVPPTKRRKLTFAENEVLRIEKQYRDRQKAEEKARRDEEKQAKEEERRAKEEEMKEAKKKREEEREEKRKLRDAEKLAKDEEKRKRDAKKKARDDEKAKKEKSQLRLNSFFTKPSLPRCESPFMDRSGQSSRRSSIASVDEAEAAASLRSTSVSLEQPTQSHSEQYFPSFFVHAHTSIAPVNRFLPEEEGVEGPKDPIDDGVNSTNGLGSLEVSLSKVSILDLLRVPARKRRRLSPVHNSVKDLISKINGSVEHPIDLTTSGSHFYASPTKLLKAVPVKYLRFAEDVRPPYIGTYSKLPKGLSAMELSRKPFSRALPATNYDYDSEAEWEEPEEGEDLDSEGEEEIGDEDEGDDMEEFLDDDDADKNGAKRRNIMGDVQPVCTGLHWQSMANQKGPRLVPYGNASLDLKTFRLDVLLVDRSFPLDPYSTSYWPSLGKAAAETKLDPSSTASMGPPARIPLSTISGTNSILPLAAASSYSPLKDPNFAKASPKPQTSKAKTSLPSKPIPAELLEDFKKAVDGSDLTKAGLVEVLKKKFPQITKGTVQETILLVAERTGKKEADKRWRLLP